MGRYDSSDEEYERRKKKTYRRSRSRSKSPDSRTSRKSKHKKHSSRSRRRHSRSRSRSEGRSLRKKSRSYSRDRRRSKSRGRYRSRERSYDYRHSRSRSHSGHKRRRSRSDSRSRRRYSPDHSSTASRDHSSSRSVTEGISKSFADMTPSEQNQARMQLAIEKAKAADEAIRQRHGVFDDEPADTKKRQQALKSIESEGFTQQTFSSSRYTSDQSKKKDSEFVFGTSLDYVKSTSSGSGPDSDSLMHSRFFEDEVERKEKWFDKLRDIRHQLLTNR
ncbi:serine/Arginine-related protein 53-like [Watersipora subatra]|uniref:serine/Arginine-related protein 53-like n=1 Tax=Watersipora subatra TaxID=2589382 RepID=UPI00355B2A43